MATTAIKTPVKPAQPTQQQLQQQQREEEDLFDVCCGFFFGSSPKPKQPPKPLDNRAKAGAPSSATPAAKGAASAANTVIIHQKSTTPGPSPSTVPPSVAPPTSISSLSSSSTSFSGASGEGGQPMPLGEGMFAVRSLTEAMTKSGSPRTEGAVQGFRLDLLSALKDPPPVLPPSDMVQMIFLSPSGKPVSPVPSKPVITTRITVKIPTAKPADVLTIEGEGGGKSLPGWFLKGTAPTRVNDSTWTVDVHGTFQSAKFKVRLNGAYESGDAHNLVSGKNFEYQPVF